MMGSSFRLCTPKRKRWHPVAKRLSWFIFGATLTAWLIKRKEIHDRAWGHCLRPHLPYVLPETSPSTLDPQNPAPWWEQLRDISKTINHCSHNHVYCGYLREQPEPSSTSSSKTLSVQRHSRWGSDPMDDDPLERILNHAAESMAEMTEVSLESIIQTVKAIKKKLVYHRIRSTGEIQANSGADHIVDIETQ